MINFGVRPEKQEALRLKMERLGIREQDILEKFIHGGGKGGQKINKSASCVYLKHRPTGIEVKCQAERSQLLNRFLARRILAEKIGRKILGEQNEEIQRVERIRRQKRRRSRRAKLTMLQAKKKRAKIKLLRAFRPGPEDV
ncbi:MAG TPA: peptide chain release factor-like protein [Candidatus Desulfaltia sp.]|nr:peptide chain release factor-like protein [Candidatus Desulfaltia sp.]